MNKKLRSKILEAFDVETLIDINYIIYSDINNKQKSDRILKLLTGHNIKYSPLGSGTNRLGIMIGDTVFKIAYDEHGKMDNRREFKYTDKLQPFVCKVYECLPDGLIISCEPYSLLSEAEFIESKEEILEILREISKNFFFGDIGFDIKNYANWGRRKSDRKIGILDFAYIYSVGYQTFSCDCDDHPFLHYDKNFVNMICPLCGKKWSFGDIRKRISTRSERNEVGDIMTMSYVLTKPEQIVEENPNYTLSLYNDYLKKEEEKILKQTRKERNREIIDKMENRSTYSLGEFELNEATTMDEFWKKLGQ